jgi:Flp pilus assembly protein TadG
MPSMPITTSRPTPLRRTLRPRRRGLARVRQAAHEDAGHDPRTPRDRERGAVAAQVVIALVVLVFLVLGIVQVVLAAYANHIAQGAAEQALDAARTLGGTTANGRAEARDVLAQLATGPLVDPRVSVTRTATTVTVTITGRAERVWLGPALPVHASVSGPIEQFRAAP